LHIICPYEDGRIAEAKLIGFWRESIGGVSNREAQWK
jgi:hypothetical protein